MRMLYGCHWKMRWIRLPVEYFNLSHWLIELKFFGYFCSYFVDNKSQLWACVRTRRNFPDVQFGPCDNNSDGEKQTDKSSRFKEFIKVNWKDLMARRVNGKRGARRNTHSFRAPLRCHFVIVFSVIIMYCEIGSPIKHLWRTILIFMRMSEMITVSCVWWMESHLTQWEYGNIRHVAARDTRKNIYKHTLQRTRSFLATWTRKSCQRGLAIWLLGMESVRESTKIHVICAKFEHRQTN